MSSESHRRTRTIALLVLLLAWAVGLRLWYASSELNIQRYWDEKYSVPNVRVAVTQGSLEPARYAYLRLTYLPHAAVLGTLQAAIRLHDPDFSWFQGPVLRPAGFMICRSIQALLGGFSIVLTFLVGRRLFSDEVGLLAGLLVAAAPTHLLLSSYFKPDIMVLTTVLLAFVASLRAIERPTIPRYLQAGLAVGLAMSSKPTGGLIAIPLALAAVGRGWKRRHHWLGLIAAGLTALALFLILNPRLDRYRSAFDLQQRRYRTVAARRGTLDDPMAIAERIGKIVFDGFFGTWVGWVAVLGIAYLLVRIWQVRGEPGRAIPIAMLLGFTFAYPLVYASVTSNVLPNNMLPLLPFVAVAAAALIERLWVLARRLLRPLQSPWLAVPLILTFVLLVAARANSLTYRIRTPTTARLALATLEDELETSGTPWIRWEEEGSRPAEPSEPGPPRNETGSLVVRSVPHLSTLEQEAVELADAEVFPQARLSSAEGEWYRQRMASVAETDVRRIEPAPFRAWGPALVVLLHPWREAGSRSLSPGRTHPGGHLDLRIERPAPDSELAALELGLPRRLRPQDLPRVEIDGRAVQLERHKESGPGAWTTERFRIPREGAQVYLHLPAGLHASPSLRVTYWSGRSASDPPAAAR